VQGEGERHPEEERRRRKEMTIVTIIETIIIILISVAYITLAERKIMGSMQRRRGPNIVGIYGILQPIVDGGKLMIKEIIIPKQSNKINYMQGPIIILILALIIFIPIPINNLRAIIQENNNGIIYILAISSLSVYGVIMSG